MQDLAFPCSAPQPTNSHHTIPYHTIPYHYPPTISSTSLANPLQSLRARAIFRPSLKETKYWSLKARVWPLFWPRPDPLSFPKRSAALHIVGSRHGVAAALSLIARTERCSGLKPKRIVRWSKIAQIRMMGAARAFHVQG